MDGFLEPDGVFCGRVAVGLGCCCSSGPSTSISTVKLKMSNLRKLPVMTRDLERYRNRYDGEKLNDTKMSKNVLFYRNEIRSSPDGEFFRFRRLSKPNSQRNRTQVLTLMTYIEFGRMIINASKCIMSIFNGSFQSMRKDLTVMLKSCKDTRQAPSRPHPTS